MKSIEKALRELRDSLFPIIFFENFLTSLIVFFIAFVLLIFLNFSWLFATIPFAVFFLYIMKKSLNKFSLKEVEDKLPELKEELRTAADNVKKENLMIDGLNVDVLRKLKHFSNSLFVDFQRIWIKVLAIFFLAFLTVLLSSLNLHFNPNYAIDLAKIPFTYQKAREVSGFAGDAPSYYIGNDSLIYGNASLADISPENLELTLQTLSTDVDISDIRTAEDRLSSSFTFPKEIYSSAEESFNEKIKKRHQRIVKSYFRELNN